MCIHLSYTNNEFYYIDKKNNLIINLVSLHAVNISKKFNPKKKKKKCLNRILNFLLNFTEDLKAKHAVLITNY